MEKQKFKAPKYVLIFSHTKVLIAIVRSVHAAAKLTNGNLQAISFACTGKYIASGGYYFRHIQPDMKVRVEDLNQLKLEEYDDRCGNVRCYYSTKELAQMRSRKPNKQLIKNKKSGGKTE
jgi:hypothetical protein